MRKLRKVAPRVEGEPKTLCVKCRHSLCIIHRQSDCWVCYGPWPKKIDPVDGKPKPFTEDCWEKNGGDCEHFSPKVNLLNRFWATCRRLARPYDPKRKS